ncbi:MAG TPA: PfkB family carbohydrate kinase [Acidimicrobiales bacterium]|nr:PfkB family carbohydrate kinase [Acidimicrobiales bacterium]
MSKVVTLGEILVELMAKEQGEGFRQAVPLVGPFPSGAPAIFIDQVARLGHPCGIIGCVGDDDFGWVNLDRLQRDGVDVSAVEVLAGQATGSAFVRYRPNGERDFVYNIRNSASGQIRMTQNALRLLGECSHLHISGASLFSGQVTQTAFKAIEAVKSNGGSVSFDPNVRKEVTKDPGALSALRQMLAACDLFLPSGDELTLLTEASDPESAVEEILGLGASAVVVKRGSMGATYYGRDGQVASPAYRVQEVDPTGAGDCFGATYITCRLLGRSVADSLRYANAAGARAVTVRGPMEGTSDFAQLEEIRSGEKDRGRGKRRFVGWLGGVSRGKAISGITSVCSAHPMVLEAAMQEAASTGSPVLIEATCNQVNHQGGYTGLTPAAFGHLVNRIAQKVGLPRERIILGGDHLGPSPWRDLPAEKAYEQAELMVAAYVEAGFTKIHLDTSMGCRSEPRYVAPQLVATRAARLATISEKSRLATASQLLYVIGTEVPTPGGATEEIEGLHVTRPETVLETLELHSEAFTSAGVRAAYENVIAIVAQPGVEFDDQKVVLYDPGPAFELCAFLSKVPGLAFEAHSTDYQPGDRLSQLVRDGFGILKVGPGLTFALRQALYGLDRVASALRSDWHEQSLTAAMENEMVANPKYWQPYYHGSVQQQHWLRHFSYSDRIRYYWASKAAEDAVEKLFAHLGDKALPEPLLSEFLPTLSGRAISGTISAQPRGLALQAVRDVLRVYAAACETAGPA